MEISYFIKAGPKPNLPPVPKPVNTQKAQIQT